MNKGTSTSGEPVVSVVMPSYNAGGFLSEAVRSILAQTFTDLELIVIDDASTDASREVLSHFESVDPRVRVIINEQNKGNYPCRNVGLSEARGEFVAVMDADDVAEPRRLERQLQFMREHPMYTLVGSQALLIDPEGAPIGLKGGLYTDHEDVDAALMDRKWAIVHPTVTMRRSAVDAIGGYREKFRTCADHDLYIRLAEIGRITNLPDVLLSYRQHYGSLTRLQMDQQHNLHVIEREARMRRNLPAPDEEEIPEIQTAESLERRQKMRLRYRWATLAMQEGYWGSALKNLGYSFALDPLGAARTTVGRVRRRFARA